MQLHPPPQKTPAADVTRPSPRIAPLAPAALPAISRPPAPAIDEAVAGASPSGRYEVCTTLRGRNMIYRTDDLDAARNHHGLFAKVYASEREALFGIYDFRTRETVESWRGGKPHGPVDLRHPMEKLMARAIRSGEPVHFIRGRRRVSFNIPGDNA